MQPLKKVVGDARIVALGEATHGSREFFQLKHRMLEFLATLMGFTIFTIEASMPEAYKLKFTGFDMQYPAVANQIVHDFVARADPEYAQPLAQASNLRWLPR